MQPCMRAGAEAGRSKCAKCKVFGPNREKERDGEKEYEAVHVHCVCRLRGV